MTWSCPTVTFKESMTEPDRNPVCFDPDPGLEQEVKMGLILQYEIPQSLPYLCVRVRERIWVLEEDKYDHNWKEYRPIIKEYNRRNLTSDGDITRAFAGIIEVIGSHTRQSFHFGLPAAIFNIAMLWQPSSPRPRRRLTRTVSDRGHTILSWSWMGWQCDLNLDSWQNKPDYQFTTALVEWHSEPLCPWRQQIFYENPTSVEPDSSLCLCRQIANARQFVSNAHTIERSSLLYCRSERTWLYADNVAKEASRFSEPVYLYNRRNARVGHIVLLCKPRGQGNSTPSSGHLPRQEMELILISKGYVSRDVTYKYDYRSDLDSDICEHLESAGRDYQFYNVLGVGWLNGIAYRVGLRRVEAKALAEEPKEVLDVVFG